MRYCIIFLTLLVAGMFCACEKNAASNNNSDISGYSSQGIIAPVKVCDVEPYWSDTGFSLDGYIVTDISNIQHSLSTICHLLLFYKLNETDISTIPHGDLALGILLDESNAIKFFGKSPFIRTSNGLRYVLNDDPFPKSRNGELHRDQCLCTLAYLDIPRNTSIFLKNGDVISVYDLLRESIASFDLEQKEPAWTAIAFAHYLPPETSWKNKFNEESTFNQLVSHLLAIFMERQSCAGTHIFQALIHIHNANIRHPILDKDISVLLNQYLDKLLLQIYENQNPDGSWGWKWCDNINYYPHITSMSEDEIKLIVTGHILECIIDLSYTYTPNEAQVLSAVNWFVQYSQEIEVDDKGKMLCPYTHAAIAASRFIEYYKVKDLH